MMNDRDYTQRPLNGANRGYMPSNLVISIAEDPGRAAAFILLIAIFFLMLLAGGICIWPYLFSCMQQAGGFDSASSIGKLVISSGISGLAGLLFSLYLCWFHEWRDTNDFSFAKIFMLVYMAEVCLSFILIPVMKVDMLGIVDPNGWTQVLGFLFHGMLGALVTMLPSLAAALIGYLLNRLWFLTHGQKL